MLIGMKKGREINRGSGKERDMRDDGGKRKSVRSGGERWEDEEGSWRTMEREKEEVKIAGNRRRESTV